MHALSKWLIPIKVNNVYRFFTNKITNNNVIIFVTEVILKTNFDSPKDWHEERYIVFM